MDANLPHPAPAGTPASNDAIGAATPTDYAPAQAGPPPSPGARTFRNTLAAAAAVALAFIAWRLVDVLLLIFACTLVAMMFFQFARLIQGRLRLPFWASLMLAILLPLGGIGLAFYLFGSAMAEQFANLATQLPAAFEWAEGWLKAQTFGPQLMARVQTFAPDGATIANIITTGLGYVGTALSILGLILVGGIYIAAQPRLYAEGVLGFIPPEPRARVVRTVAASGAALNGWLKAQGLGMLFVAVATSIGLSLVGVPNGAALGIIGGLCEFVPYLGVIVVTIPAIILGFAQDTTTGLLAIAVLVVVQQVQGNIVQPMAQSKMADLPPALTIFSLIAFGILLGPMGVILAVPLTVVGVVVLKEITHRHPVRPYSPTGHATPELSQAAAEAAMPRP